jgi:hypothetical protein
MIYCKLDATAVYSTIHQLALITSLTNITIILNGYKGN